MTPEQILSIYQSGKSLAEVALITGLSRERVRQLISKLPGYKPHQPRSKVLDVPEQQLTPYQEWKKRQLTGVESPKCQYCGVLLRSPKTKERLICSDCWLERGGEAQKAENRERQAKFQQGKKRQQTSEFI